MRFTHRSALAGLCMMLTACTQQPARIANHSGDYYAKDGVRRKTAANPPARFYSEGTVEQESDAPIESVSVSELEPQREHSTAKSNTLQSKARDRHIPFGKANPEDENAMAALKEREEEKEVELHVRADTNHKPESAVESKEIAAYIWPVEGKVTQRFGLQGAGKNREGIVIAAEEGEPVFASAGGEVVYTGARVRSYGKMVIIRHKGDMHTTYAHLSEIATKRGDTIKQGEIVGYVGASGIASKSQLFFAMRDAKKQPMDPLTQLKSEVASR